MSERVNRTPARSGVEGFSLIELITVVAVLGIVVAMATPSVVRMLQRQETKTSATQMAGLLSDARARAVAEGTPHLVYFNPPTVNGDGECGAAAVEVRDADHSYSITAGDDSREFHLGSGACGKVKQLGEGSPENLEKFADVSMPEEDLAVRAPDAGEEPAEAAEVDEKAAKEAEKAAEKAEKAAEKAAKKRSAKVVETVVNGATFPVDEDSGRPVIAFSERGIPVDPADHNEWGSGAGGIYLTDADGSAVFAALVAPLGEVMLRAYDASSGTWK